MLRRLGYDQNKNWKKYPLVNTDEIRGKWIQPAEEKNILIGVEFVDTNQQNVMVVFNQQVSMYVFDAHVAVSGHATPEVL